MSVNVFQHIHASGDTSLVSDGISTPGATTSAAAAGGNRHPGSTHPILNQLAITASGLRRSTMTAASVSRATHSSASEACTDLMTTRGVVGFGGTASNIAIRRRRGGSLASTLLTSVNSTEPWRLRATRARSCAALLGEGPLPTACRQSSVNAKWGSSEERNGYWPRLRFIRKA